MDIYQFLTIEAIILSSTLAAIAIACLVFSIIWDRQLYKWECENGIFSGCGYYGGFGGHTDYTDQDVAAMNAATTTIINMP